MQQRDAGDLVARPSAPAGRRHHDVLPCAYRRGLRICRRRISAVRAEIDAQAARSGLGGGSSGTWPQVDPEAAARIHINDPQRIQRALEVHRITGETITKLQQARVSVFADVNVIEFALAPLERGELHTKIELRFKAMLDAGFVEEVRRLYERGDLSPEHPSMRAVGYRQLWRYLAGHSALNEADESGHCGDATTRQAAIDLASSAQRMRGGWIPCVRTLHARLLMHYPRADLRSGLPLNGGHCAVLALIGYVPRAAWK